MRIIVPRDEEMKLSHCWMDFWVSPYESAFSLLSKYTYLNALRTPDIGREFVRKKLGKISAQNNPINFCLLQPTHLDQEKMSLAMRLDMGAISYSFIPDGIKPSSIPVSEFLRFCPTCLKIGYHSVAHQFELLDVCPIHHIKIQSNCMNCNGAIQYRLNSTVFAKPFCCPHCLSLCYGAGLDDITRYKSLRKSEAQYFGDLIELFALKQQVFDTAVDIQRASALFDQQPILIANPANTRSKSSYLSFLGSALKYALPEFRPVNELFSCDLTWIQYSGFISPDARKARAAYQQYPCQTLDIFDWRLKDNKLFEMRPIYKSIRRYILRRILKKHRACVRTAANHIWWNIDGESTQPICTLSYAYIQWLSFWEGTAIPQQLFMKPTHPPFRVMAWLCDAAPYTPTTWPLNAARWLRCRVFALDCLRSFYTWVAVAQRMVKQKNSLTWAKTYSSEHATAFWLAQQREDFSVLMAYERSGQNKPITLLHPGGKEHFLKHAEMLRTIVR